MLPLDIDDILSYQKVLSLIDFYELILPAHFIFLEIAFGMMKKLFIKTINRLI